MKYLLFILSTIITLSTISCKVELFSCLKGEGDIETRTINIDDITGVEIDLDAEIIITEGPTQDIQITAHGNVIDKILEDSKIQGNTWEIDTKGCSNLDKIQIAITLPTIEVASINGSGIISTNGVFNNIEKINLEIDGEGEMNFKLATVSKVDIEIKGSGTIKVSGATVDQSIDIKGSGVIRNFDLSSKSTRIDVSGDADCNISVDDLLRADLSGSGRICFRGDPTLSLDNSGSVQVDDCN